MPFPDAAEPALHERDLGPLAWVAAELRRGIEAAVKSLRRFVHEAEAAQQSDLDMLDTSAVRAARQHLHQVSGALEMVGMEPSAVLVRAMEAAVQKFLQRPALCDEPAVAIIERAGFALGEYLDAVLAGKTYSAVGLFPQYRDVQALAGAERVHPADLWPAERRSATPRAAGAPVPLPYGPVARAQLDQAVLKVVKEGDVDAARKLSELSQGFAAALPEGAAQSFWRVCSGFFEAQALGLLPPDLYAKRVASRVLMQYAAFVRGDEAPGERLLQDMLFFCGHACPPQGREAPALAAVRSAYRMQVAEPVDYEARRFGRFNPVLLTQARKRIAAAAETWSALAGGDRHKLKAAADQFHLVADSLRRLHPQSAPLAHALSQALEATVRTGEPPATALAMEVATSILYLQAAYEELDTSDATMAERAAVLAERLDRARSAAAPEPLDEWMEDLYRRVSDRQTMGSVVEELRATLREAEQSLDQFFRAPQDASLLAPVPGQLAQMRGVLSVLGLEQASQAVVRMRDCVERLLLGQPAEETERSAVFDRLGNSLGALSFLIDMLGYQPTLARRLFIYDEERGELRIVMGRGRVRAGDAPEAASTVASARSEPPLPATVPLEPQPVPDPVTAPAEATAPQPPKRQSDEEDDDIELREIFLDEAREVLRNGRASVAALDAQPAALSEQTALRRAFHTLKGSARMVQLERFGEAAWAMEQLCNAWLAEQRPMPESHRRLAGEALDALARWVEDIADHQDEAWDPAAFRASADALRLGATPVPLAIAAPSDADPDGRGPDSLAGLSVDEFADADIPMLEASSTEDEGPAPVAPAEEVSFELALEPEPPEAAQVDAAMPQPEQDLQIDEIDFSEFAAAVAESGQGDRQGVAQGAAPPEAMQAVPPLEAEPPGAMPAEALPVDADEIRLDFPPFTPREPASAPEAVDAPALPAAADAALAPAPDDVKVIGALRIPIPLYNVYLNEADEWSRRLVTELTEWSMELHRRLSDVPIGLAHSLAGSSATVGFRTLSGMARLLEQALQHVQVHGGGTVHQAGVFVDTAEDIRYLLHQFAAGFLKEPTPRLLRALQAIIDSDDTSAVPSAASFLRASEDEAPEPSGEPEAQPAAAPLDDFSDVFPREPEPAQSGAAQEPAPCAEPRNAAERRVDDAIARAVGAGAALGDDFDVVDAVDQDLFPIFEEEAQELLPQLGGALRQWAAHPDNHTARAEVLRALHTLKGSARLAGAMRLGELAHRFETAIDELGSDTLQPQQIEPLFVHADALRGEFDRLRAAADAPAPAETPVAAAPEAAPAPLLEGAAAAPRGVVTPQRTPLAAAARGNAGPSVRVRSQLLDRLVNQAGEVMISRSRLEARLGQMQGSLGELTGNLDRLRRQLRDIEVQAESQMQSRLAQAKDSATGFDPLEFDRFTRVQELTRMMAESVDDVATVQRNLQRAMQGTEDELAAQGRQARELQRDLLRTRMVEFEGIAERLYAVARQAAKETGKPITLTITGGAVEMDRGVLERLAPAFEHLLRNAVVHGIEDAQTRAAAGKPATGTIAIGLRQDGNDVALEFRDDGAGLDHARIRDKARALGLIGAADTLDDAAAANLIFAPGVTTATEVTELAGRGIGMDVVRSEVQAAGGRIETLSQPGQGTSFRLILPLTTAVTQVVMLRAGALAFAVPATVVEIVRRATAQEIEQAYASASFRHGADELPFFWSGALLQACLRSQEPPTRTRPVVIFRSAQQRIALHVDEVLGHQEVVVKNLGPQLARLPGLSGMSVLPSGAVVLIYNPVALANVHGERIRAQLAAHAHPDAAGAEAAGGVDPASPLADADPGVPLVLVVDDSITVRRVTQRLLRREGYRVALAADGLQALERLQEERPALVLSDIEMPRMDGFDLVRNIRADAALHDLPVVMITSRIAAKHREHALSLGASHYLGKPYPEEELLGLVRRYALAGSAVPALEGTA
ncbi:Hpt domain-containing protein [Xylophilus sp. ASV27]|uniref:Hpt domain-containing protein n=1 Tax=Xylophilus sp. ASV27 TaxID=2795129 RepID=UPI0018ED6D5E|nr:Hpt domain-containing protein [Xylophilus sp. ASV27]